MKSLRITQKEEKPKMNSDIKVFMIVAIAILIGIGAVMLSFLIDRPTAVVTINKNVIDSNEFGYYYTQNVSSMLQNKPDPYMDNTTFLNSPIDSSGTMTVKDYVKEYTLNQVIEIEFLLLRAKEEGFKVSGKELNDEWEIFKNNLLQNAKSSGMSLKEFSKAAFGVGIGAVEKIFKDYLITEKYVEAKTKEITVDDAALTAFYDEYKDYIDHATVRHILVSCEEDADENTVAEKKKLAEDILAKVNNGGDFVALAKEYSEDPGSKDSGGVYELKPSGGFVQEFKDWTFSHKPGDTGIVKTEFGFHVMKLDSITNTLDAQREEAVSMYQSMEYRKNLEEALNSDQYEVDVKDAYQSF